MNYLFGSIVAVVMVIGAAQVSWASCNPDIKQQMVATLSQEANACPPAEDHCLVNRRLKILIDSGLYGPTSGYVQKFQQCLKPGVDGCNLPEGAVVDPNHAFVLITLATDPSYVAAQGKPDLKTAVDTYQCVNELLGEVLTFNNVIELPRVAVAPAQAPQNAGANNAGGVAVTGLECKSTIFDCDKPLAFYQLPIGKYCRTDVLAMGKNKQLLLVSGLDAHVVLDLRSSKAVACKDAKPKTTCDDNELVMIGKNADGSTHLAVVDNGVMVNPASAFQKMTASAKPLLEVVSQPVTHLCDEIFKEAQSEFNKSAFPLPSTEKVAYNGKDEAVEVLQGVLRGNKAFLVMKSKASQAILGVSVMTLGDSAAASKLVFKAFPAEMIAASYTKSPGAAILSGDDTRVRMMLALSTKDKGDEAVECDIPLDDATPMTCDLQNKVLAAGEDAAKLVHKFVGSKLKEKSMEEFGNSEFGSRLSDTLPITPDANLDKFMNMIMHGFEGFGLVPNALMTDATGSRVYRQGSDGKVVVDANEILPGVANDCVLADIDNYGGKDLVCFSGNVIMFIPKRNLPPQIDQLTLDPAADSAKSQLKSVVQTQKDEELNYQWRVYEVRNGQLVEHPELLEDATVANPQLKMAVDMGSGAATGKIVHATSGTMPDVTVNASLGKSAKAVSPDLPENGFVAMVTVKDAGGLSDTALVPIAVTKSVATPPSAFQQGAKARDATVVEPSGGGSMFAMEGGFGCAMTRSDVTPASILALVLVLLPTLCFVPIRAAVRIRRK